MCSFSLCFSAQLLVLIAALFLLVYVTKQQVSKWFTYGSVAIIIVTLIMMICSLCCTLCMSHCSSNGAMNGNCGPNQNCGNEMMMCSPGGSCSKMGGNPHMMMCKDGSSCEGMAGCEDMSECESNEETTKVIVIEKDSVVKKK
ncbi:MAG: hypothetical protein V4667_13355 [Bacteroidota bacterium]